jgi:hypothetical protein
MRMRHATVAFLLAVCAGVSSAYGQDTTLRYHWVKGDEVRYRFSQQSGSTLSGPQGASESTTNLSLTMVVRMAVQDVAADGAATLRETFESLRVEQVSPLGKAVFDSASGDKPAGQPAATLGSYMSAMVGESVIVEMGPDGGTRKVEGMSAIFDKMLKSLPPGPAADLVAGQLKGFMSDDAIHNMIGQSFDAFPDRPIKTGETWTNESEQTNPLFGKVPATRTSTLSRVESRNGALLAHIAVRLAVKPTGPGTPISPGISATMGNSESAGEIVFDTTRGRLQQTSITVETPMDLTVPQPGGGEPLHLKGVARNVLTMEIVEK